MAGLTLAVHDEVVVDTGVGRSGWCRWCGAAPYSHVGAALWGDEDPDAMRCERCGEPEVIEWGPYDDYRVAQHLDWLAETQHLDWATARDEVRAWTPSCERLPAAHNRMAIFTMRLHLDMEGYIEQMSAVLAAAAGVPQHVLFGNPPPVFQPIKTEAEMPENYRWWQP